MNNSLFQKLFRVIGKNLIGRGSCLFSDIRSAPSPSGRLDTGHDGLVKAGLKKGVQGPAF